MPASLGWTRCKADAVTIVDHASITDMKCDILIVVHNAQVAAAEQNPVASVVATRQRP